MAISKHTHKLKKHTYKTGSSVFFCTLDCSYKVSVELSLGKTSICWRCGKPFSLDEYSLRLVRPHCKNCHKFKNEVPSIAEINAGDQINTANDLRNRLSSVVGTNAIVVEMDDSVRDEDI